jgi:hypothetical protein
VPELWDLKESNLSNHIPDVNPVRDATLRTVIFIAKMVLSSTERGLSTGSRAKSAYENRVPQQRGHPPGREVRH